MAAHVMVDLETCGTQLNSAVLSIGAVVFDAENIGSYKDESGAEVTCESFYRTISLDDCLKLGMTFDRKTLDFWLSVEPAIRAEAFSGTKRLSHAMWEFGRWIPKDAFVWSHGATFDLAILISVHERLNWPVPWHYRNGRDTRTLFDLSPPDEVPEKNKHHALFDAERQAMMVQSSWRKLKA